MIRRACVLASGLALCAATVSAQSRPAYLQFDPYTVKGVLYRPDGGDPDIGVLLIHRVNNYLGHIAGPELARRGFLVLAMNSRFDNNEASVLWERIALDVKTGVEYLRKQGGVRRVILFGHSGGAATLSFYQAVAEQGPAFCQAPGKLTHCRSDEVSNLPRADGLVLVGASLGNPVGLLLTLKSFLTANAIRSTNSMTGVEWCSTNNSTPCALQAISVPLLVSAMGGNTGIRDNEWLFEHAASRDKDFFVLEGATHNIDPCTECETRKGEYGNAVRNFFNYLRDWINRRFAR